MVVNDGEILEAAGMLSNSTTHISLGSLETKELQCVYQLDSSPVISADEYIWQ